MNIISGEQLQQLADIYIGYSEDFDYNPIIRSQSNKFVFLHELNRDYNNPMIVFCYGHRIHELSTKIHLFQNDFILITHNSDENIIDNTTSQCILYSPKLIRWYAQNICFYNSKLYMLPIGIANSMWPHGDKRLYNNPEFMKYCDIKNKNVYFTFNIDTNRQKREPCYNSLKNKLEWLSSIPPVQNTERLAEYKFCICPEGNGVDTHRLWEALYLKCIPIVIKSPFTDTLLRNNIPVIVLDNWDEFDESKLIYNFTPFHNIDTIIRFFEQMTIKSP
jgi:hypothetical protein